MTTLRQIAGLVAGLALVVAGCSPTAAPPVASPSSEPSSAPPSVPAGQEVLPDAAVAPLLEAVPHRTVKPLPAHRLADGLTPPTNRWYSGLVFGDEPMSVFPLPLGFALTGDGFALGLPRVVANPATIAGGFVPDVAVGVGADHSVVANSDPSVVVLDNLAADGARVGTTTIAQGSPFVAWLAERAASVTLPEGFQPAGDDLYAATIGGVQYALLAPGAAVSGGTVDVPAGGSLVFWPVPEGTEVAALASAASHLVTGSEVTYQVGDDQVSTSLTYLADGPTAMARLPHQAADQACELGSYPSVLGTMQLCEGSTLTWSAPRLASRAALDLSGLDDGQREQLREQLDADLADLPDLPADTYFGGKALQRLAMLLMVAEQLELPDRAEQAAGALDEALTKWTEPQGCAQREAFCFVYDPEGRGMIGLTPSFGSDEYNDHHFHYGYFLYAAAVLAGHDPTVVERYAPVMTLLAADIASSGGEHFPARRAFDPYGSHSWASGTSPFADGNNQESVSESVNAYAGLELWAQAAGDQPLATQAAWMASAEAQSGLTYWTNPDLSEFPGYQAGIVSLLWGGKRDYATWFSPEPAAKLAILLLPMSPSSGYLAGDPDRIRANVDEATGGNFRQQFGDYLLMYSALAGTAERDAALATAADLPDDLIDDGLSRTYLLAWLLSLR